MSSRSRRMADRISALPDSIISHILSFLPTQQAVATSVLSKRWISLWRAISALHFDDEIYSENKDAFFRFVQLVYTAMLLRGGEKSIKEFHLCCKSSFCDASIVNIWLMAANQCKAEHLSLSLHSTISLPFSVFTSTTLVVLKLSRFSILKSNSAICFPSLKGLHMTNLCFQKYEYLVDILSTCPILEVLVIKSLRFGDFTEAQMFANELYLNLPKLVKVDVSESSLNINLQSFHNVGVLHADLILIPSFHTHNFNNLTYMELCLHHYVLWNWLFELLDCCPNLQNLVIGKRGALYWVSSKYNFGCWQHSRDVPKFLLSNLKSLRVCSYRGKECELQFTKFIMQNGRVLRKVTICIGNSLDPQEKLQMITDLSLCPRASPTCELHFE